MKVIKAKHLGMCFGVRDAIALAKREAQSQPITVLGDLVHNETVLSDLRKHAIAFEQDLSGVKTSAVMITAHGASDLTINRVRAEGHDVIEATCPLVHFAHRSLRSLVEKGYHPVVIGQRGHVEVRGLTEDFPHCDVVLSSDDIQQLQERSRFGVISQTTQPVQRVRQLVALLQMRFPQSEVRFIDTVCQPTKQRQTAAIELAKHSNVVVVVGGANSNNTRELVKTCNEFCSRVFHVQTAADLRPEWLEGANVVGLTAGTSTPDTIIDAVERRLHELSAPALAA